MRHLESSRICIIKENAGFMPAFYIITVWDLHSLWRVYSICVDQNPSGRNRCGEYYLCLCAAKSLELSDKWVEIHGIRKADLHEHGVRAGHTVAFQYIWTCFNKWIEGWLLFWIKSHVYKCCDVISESLMVDACVIPGQYSCFFKPLYSCWNCRRRKEDFAGQILEWRSGVAL